MEVALNEQINIYKIKTYLNVFKTFHGLKFRWLIGDFFRPVKSPQNSNPLTFQLWVISSLLVLFVGLLQLLYANICIIENEIQHTLETCCQNISLRKTIYFLTNVDIIKTYQVYLRPRAYCLLHIQDFLRPRIQII